jgi:hypothetical protein
MIKANDISGENALIQDAFREEYRPKCALRRDTKRRLEYPRRGTAIPSGHSVPGLGTTSILKFTDFPYSSPRFDFASVTLLERSLRRCSGSTSGLNVFSEVKKWIKFAAVGCPGKLP